jgi:predicted nuclease with RNAse H fold
LPVITAGLDLAAMPERTALASIEWAGTRAAIRDVICPADDSAILEMIGRTDKTGIDCPLGWPDTFVDFVAAHRSGHVALPRDGTGPGWRRELTMRRTDLFVRDKLRLVPMSVSADRIAHVALRCAVLLAKLAASGHPVDRSGAGPVAEVYPAASLRGWGLRHRGYKQPGPPDALAAAADELLAAVPWLDCGPYEETIRRSHDAFDAVVAALTARAASRGQTCPPGEDDLAAATTEGWIAVPRSPISQLVSDPLAAFNETREHQAGQRQTRRDPL